MKFKELLEPLKYDIKSTILIIGRWVFISITIILSTIILKNVISWIENNNILFSIQNAIFLAIIYIFTFLYLWLTTKRIKNIEEGIMSFLYKKYLKIFNNIDNEVFEKTWNWRYLNVLQKWLNSWKRILMWLSVSFIINIFIVIFFLYQAFIYNIIVFGIVLILLIITFLFIKLFASNLISIAKQWKEEETEIDRLITRTLNSKFETMQSIQIDKIVNIVEEKIQDNKKHNWYKFQKYNEGLFMLSNILIFILRFWVYGTFLYLAYNNVYNISTLSMLVMYVWIMDTTLNFFIRWYIDFIHWQKDINKMNELFLNSKKISNLSNWEDFIYKWWHIKLNNVNFWYSWKNTNILNNFNLEIKSWSKISFIGTSWNWKSTIVKLITWYFKPNKWNVVIDWQDLSDIKLESYYNQIWYLTQDTPLFDWTIKDNLIINDEKIEDEKIIEVLKKAKCDFIFDLPNWIYTEIWERWIMLSWWQKQKIWIAKIIIKNPKIFILDEPTSALDSNSEKEITDILKEITKDKTTITIAHRLKTIKDSDIIYVIEEGKIVESWSHKNLIKHNNWYYNKLLSNQII